METVKVIVKREKVAGADSLVLFFPESTTNYGKIECWSFFGEHSEASMGYFWGLKPPRLEDEDAVEKLLSFYEQRYSMAGPFKLKRIQRDNQRMRCDRWKRK